MPLVETICERLAARDPVSVVGGNTKSFLGGHLTDEPVSMRDHAGIINYEPTELVLTARAEQHFTRSSRVYVMRVKCFRLNRLVLGSHRQSVRDGFWAIWAATDASR